MNIERLRTPWCALRARPRPGQGAAAGPVTSGVRLIAIGSAVFAFVLTAAISGDQSERTHQNGQQIFRFDTFGDEQLWTNVLRMHEAVRAVDPATALGVGLK